LLQHSVGCTAHFTQFAGIEALHGPQDRVAEVREIYQKRRDLIVDGLNQIPGVSCRKPQGAFYAFPNVKALGKSADELADLLLKEGGVAVLPGTSFGKYGDGYLRLSYVNSFENIEKGLDRIQAALKKNL